MNICGRRGVSISNGSSSSVEELVCQSSLSGFFKSANISLSSDSPNDVSALKLTDSNFDNLEFSMSPPKRFIRQNSNYSSTSSGESTNRSGSSDLEDEEELSLFDHSTYTVHGTVTHNIISDSCRKNPATHLRSGSPLLCRENLDVQESRRKRSSSDSVLLEPPKISKVHTGSASSYTFKEMIKQSFLDSASGTLDEPSIANMCRVFALPRKTILKRFNNHRIYVESKIQSLLIEMNVEDMCSPLISQIASKLRASSLKVKNCFNKYSHRIQEAIRAKKTKPPLSDVI